MPAVINFSLSDDIIDLRDLIARVEELENLEPADETEKWNNCDEFAALTDILEELAGNGGDEQWRGDWYPITLIRDDYFTTYAQELADDIGAVPANVQWPLNCIDWEMAARDLKMDYSSVEINGSTYWYR